MRPQTSRRKRKIRIYEPKREDPGDLCLLVENGEPCNRMAISRGLCTTHYVRLIREGVVERYALPCVGPRVALRKRYRVKEAPEPDLCRVMMNEVPCARPAERRGLCLRHYYAIYQRGDLRLEDFALPNPEDLPIRRRKKPVEGECRVEEGGVPCRERPAIRGLCLSHYRRLEEKRPQLFEEIALPAQGSARITLRPRPVPGRCRAAVEGAGCSLRAVTRGLCMHHYGVLRKNPALLASIALPAKFTVRLRFERRDDAGADPGLCVVVENGVPCTRPPERRGVCRRHRRQIGSRAGYSIGDFYLDEPVAKIRLKGPEWLEDGLCRAEEDGVPCDRPPDTRGVCRRHYKLARKLGRVEEIALPSRPAKPAPFGSANDRPHFYLDKNVLIDHADQELFGATGQAASSALVRAAKAGKIRTTLNFDGVKSTYNHVRYRLTRAAEEGGRGLPEDAAEAVARKHMVDTFLSGGAFRFVILGPVDFLGATREAGALSLEDALELRAYHRARRGGAAPTMFVTRDRDFSEGVLPSRVVEELEAAGLV
jgi:hypothetical protein